MREIVLENNFKNDSGIIFKCEWKGSPGIEIEPKKSEKISLPAIITIRNSIGDLKGIEAKENQANRVDLRFFKFKDTEKKRKWTIKPKKCNEFKFKIRGILSLSMFMMFLKSNFCHEPSPNVTVTIGEPD